MKILTTIALTLAMISAASARTAPTKLPESIIGLWCFAATDYLNGRHVMEYLRNDVKAPKPDTPCTKEGDTDWVEFEADGNYQGVEMECRAVKITLIDRGVTTAGLFGTYAVYVLDAHCVAEGDLWRQRARIQVGRGGVLTITWTRQIATVGINHADARWVGRLVPLQEKKVCEGVVKPLAGNYTFGKMDGYVVGLCIFGAGVKEEKAVLGVGKCREGALCHIEAYVAAAKMPRSFTSEMCSKSLEYPNCYPPFLIRKVISSRVLNQPDGMSTRELQSEGK